MTALLAGLHDREGAAHVPPGGWVVDTVHVWNQPAANYARLGPGINWIARLNNGYGSEGTIPVPGGYDAFAEQCQSYVSASVGCTRWIVANETNHSQEWPGGQMITPQEYARCFLICREVIKQVQPNAIVIPAPIAPWNVEAGDWLHYWRQMLDAIGPGNCDGIAIHAYIRACEPGRVTSDATMDSPYIDRLSEFRAYHDTLGAMPTWAHGLPCFMTEANPLDGWRATGVMPAMLAEVADHNLDPGRATTIQCVCFYRYPDHDRWGMASKPDVIAEFQTATTGYPSPIAQTDNTSIQPLPPPPEVPKTAPPGERALSWDHRLDALGVQHKPHKTMPGVTGYRLVEARWFDVGEAQGRVNIYVDVLDEAGNRLPVPVHFWWGDGGPGSSDTKPIDPNKRDPWAEYGVDFNMSSAGRSYNITVMDNGKPSDAVLGMGLGTIAEREVKHHTAYRLVFQRHTPAREKAPIPQPQPQPPAPLPPRPVGVLVHPVSALQWPVQGWVSQHWGERPDYYQALFGIPYHNGTDIAAPAGRAIEAIADGEVMFVGEDVDYGLYVRIFHPAHDIHSFYAHNRENLVQAGQKVERGDTIARVGSTGHSTGAHLHWEIRLGSRDAYAQGTFGHTRGRVDPETVFAVLGQGEASQEVVTSLAGDMNWVRAHPIVLQIEGGLSLDPNDRGNYYDGKLVGTKYGISAAVWGGQYDIPNLTKETALQIYYKHYWLRSGADKLPWPLCLVHFDSFVQNEVAARQFLQASGGNPVLYMSERIDWYTRVPTTWSDHGRGWMRRCATILREVAK